MTALLHVLFCITLMACTLSSATSYSRSPISGLKMKMPSKVRRFSGNGNGAPPLPPSSGLYMSAADDESGSNHSLSEGSSQKNNGNGGIFGLWMELSADVRDDIKTTTLSFLFAILVRIFVIEPRFIPSLSMFPTFDIGDQLLVDKVGKFSRGEQGYVRKDVVVFLPPEAYIDLTGNKEALIKRVVATAGDTVEVKNNRLYINDIIQDEPYTAEYPNYALDKVKVPQGCLLVLGDNRNKSFDSHVWGFLPDKNVIGRAVFKYWPPWRVGLVEGST
jgi:signal peptidase I